MIVRAAAHSSRSLGEVAVLSRADLAVPFAEFRDAALGARFDPRLGTLYAPRAEWAEVRAGLLAGGVELDEDVTVSEWNRQEEALRRGLQEAARRRMGTFDLVLQKRGLSLRHYQRDGVLWLSTRRCGLLTDQMGLGKTIIALCAIPEGVGAVVVCPASLRGYWRDEVTRWRPDLTLVVLEGRGSFRPPGERHCVICSDSALVGVDYEHFGSQDWYRLYLVADEAHAFKGERSQRTQNMDALCKVIRRYGGWTVGLTGTPLLNRPEELFTLATVFGCERLGWGSEPAFKRAFEVGPDFGYGPTYGTPRPAAREGLRRISLRRTRAEVLPELPTKSYREIPVSLDGKTVRALDAAHREYSERLSALERSESLHDPAWAWHDKLPTFEGYAEVRAGIAQRKVYAMEEWVEAHEAEGLPVVVISCHREPVDRLDVRDGWVTVTGDVATNERTRRVDAFQAGQYRGIAGTIGPLGVGHTLTRAADLLFVDRPFTPGLIDQAEDRVCRIGQTRPVLISVLVGDHPLERRLERILERKRAMVAASL
jgi:SNF2 family DNA or RNA helicase